MKIKRDIFEVIIAKARRDAPIEACGYLASKDGIVTTHYPLTNLDQSREHFSFSPEEQFRAVKDARERGLKLDVVYHSHPETPARPSEEDIRLAYDENIIYLIVSLVEGREDVRAFHIRGGEVEEVEIEVEEPYDLERGGDVSMDPAELRRVGMIAQKQKGYYAMRLRTVGGDLTAQQLKKIAEVSQKYGRGEVHLSTRQGVEIHNVKQEDLGRAREELKVAGIEMGACGPRIRVVVACPGDSTCRWGIVDTKGMAAKLDEKYFRKDTPHKFKLAVTGCPHNCAKATENDIGLMGAILPEWEKESCIACDLCINVCPTRAIYKEGEDYKLDVSKCIFCSICTAACPVSSWKVKVRGWRLFLGGTMGKIPRLGTPLPELIEDEERLMTLIERAVQYYRREGRKKERFGHMIDRIGVEKVIKEITDGF